MPHEMRKCECCVFWDQELTSKNDCNGICRRKAHNSHIYRIKYNISEKGKEYEVENSQFAEWVVTAYHDWCGDIYVKGVGGWEALV